nr:hypothetical protein L204_03279 [Cryptococcus depauperatus CBS 7855]
MTTVLPRSPVSPEPVKRRGQPATGSFWEDDEDEGVRAEAIPLTVTNAEDPVTQTLGIAASSYAVERDPAGFTFTHADLARFRNGGFVKCDIEGPLDPEQLQRMTINEAVWRKWEELGGLAKGAGGLFRYGYDKHGNEYRPEMTHVQAIRLVIAASPRKMLTLAQIYQAIEERWPWHKSAGNTWKNSIRHNLSLNDCFVNAERPNHEGGSGKGGYWTVNDLFSGKTSRKIKRALRTEEESDYYPSQSHHPAAQQKHSDDAHRPSKRRNTRVFSQPGAISPEYSPNRMGRVSPLAQIFSQPGSAAARSSNGQGFYPSRQAQVFPAMSKAQFPGRSPIWQSRDLTHRPLERGYDMSLDPQLRPPSGGSWEGVLPPFVYDHEAVYDFGRVRAAVGDGQEWPRFAGGEAGWNGHHPRLDIRSGAHYGHPQDYFNPYPTPSTAHTDALPPVLHPPLPIPASPAKLTLLPPINTVLSSKYGERPSARKEGKRKRRDRDCAIKNERDQRELQWAAEGVELLALAAEAQG